MPKKNRGEPRVNKQNPNGFPLGFLPVPQHMPGSTSPMAPKKPPANDSPMSKGETPEPRRMLISSTCIYLNMQMIVNVSSFMDCVYIYTYHVVCVPTVIRDSERHEAWVKFGY
jgi:hypothetical protein